jgi:hypothetical protein
MRRLVALLLIATSAWMLYLIVWRHHGFGDVGLVEMFRREYNNPEFAFPAIAAVLGALGGLIALVGGVGGAAIAMIGGVIAAGFAMYVGGEVWNGSWRLWENQTVLSIALLSLAGVTALLGRG